MFRLTFLLLAVIGIAMLVVGNEPAGTERVAAATRPADPALRATPKPVPVADFPRPASVDMLLGVEPRPASARVEPAVHAVPAPEAGDDDARLAAAEAAGTPPRRREFLSVNDEVAARRTVQAERAAALASDTGSVREDVEAALADATVAMVTGTKVNVRSGPSTDYGVVGQVVFGEAAEILSENEGGWVRIRIQGDGVEGYIAAKFLDGSGLNN